MSRLDAMKEQYKESTSSKPVKKENKFNENNYFATFLADGVNSAQKQIRVVEPKGATESPFVSIMGHKKQVEGQWIVDQNIIHRSMSNNSIYYKTKPTREKLHWQMEKMRYSGEPAFVNEVAAARRRPNFKGVNP